MTRYKLTLEYDGGGFVGWQRQDNGPSVQEALENAVKAFCGETVTSFAAGRTDAGVHALGQVAHVDLAKDTTADTVRDALNFHLKPAPIAVRKPRRWARISMPASPARSTATDRQPPAAAGAGPRPCLADRWGAGCGGHE
jgi:tRNA pseudouridine38-40 synthase